MENLALITTNKFIFTTQHIYNNIESENWYKEITDYIEYTICSFGTFPDANCGNPFYLSSYFDYIKRYTNNLKCTGEELKRKRIILSYLDSYFTKDEDKDFDFKLIVFYYEQWYKTFPFDLIYFQHLKESYKSIPLFTNKTETNKYLNRTKVNIHTKDSLLELLINRTKKLLTEINGATLYKKGLLNDTNKVQIDLLIESRILECDTILNDDTANEKHRYLNILKKWLAGEIEFINELVKVLPPPQKTIANKAETESNNYSNKQIAIAYSIIGEQITTENASAILLKHSKNRSIDKLLQKRITKPSTLTVLSGNKTTDTMSLNDLKSAKRLLSGMKNTKAVKDIEHIITSFQTNYNNKY
jgi:hypothetical protein